MAVRWRRMRSISATVLGVMTTPRQPRLESSSTAQIRESAEVSVAPSGVDQQRAQRGSIADLSRRAVGGSLRD